jgi:uncharacterized protein YjbI with pentapeptide repeats
LQEANLVGADLGTLRTATEEGLKGAGTSMNNEVTTNLFKSNLKDANLSDANLEGANLSDATLTGADLTNARVSAQTNMTNAKFSSFAPRVRKAAASRNSGSSALWSTMSVSVCSCLKSVVTVGNYSDQDSDGDSNASDTEEMEDDESDLALEIGSVIDQIACAAAIVDAVMQDIKSAIKEIELKPCRQELRKVVEAEIRKIPAPPSRDRRLSMRESQRQRWLKVSKIQVRDCIHAVLKESIRRLFKEVLLESFKKLREIVKQRLNELQDPDNHKKLIKAVGLEPEEKKKEEEGDAGKQQPKPVAAPAALAVNVKSDLLNVLTKRASGLKWEKFSAPTEPAQGRELKNSKLAAELKQKALDTPHPLFTQREWDAFGIHGLCTNDFIKSGRDYFKPAEDAVSDVMSTTHHEQALSVNPVEDMAANLGAQLAHVIRRRLIDEIVSAFDPGGKRVKKLREQVELHAKTLATETSNKIVDSLSSVSRGTKRFKSAALVVMAANRIQPRTQRHVGNSAPSSTGEDDESHIDLSTHVRVLEEACNSFDHFLLDDGLVGLAQKTIRLGALTAVSVLSGSSADMFQEVENPDKKLTSKQLVPLLPAVSQYEDMLVTKLEKVESPSVKNLMRPNRVKASIVKGMLQSATEYTMRKSGFGGYYDMLTATMKFTRPQLAREEQDLMYVMKQIEKLQELATTAETFRDVVETWISLLDLISQISSQRALAVLQCISSDKKLLSALGAGMALRNTVGEKPPPAIVSRFNINVGQKIRANAYNYLRALEQELAIVRRTRDHQARGIALIGSAMLSIFITIGSVVGRIYNDAIKEQGESMLIWLIPVVFCGTLLVCCLCSFAAYRCVKGPSSVHPLQSQR